VGLARSFETTFHSVASANLEEESEWHMKFRRCLMTT
jgi:hypothetical protein